MTEMDITIALSLEQWEAIVHALQVFAVEQLSAASIDDMRDGSGALARFKGNEALALSEMIEQSIE